MMLGSFGSISSSAAPVCGPTYSVLLHVLPPSSVTYTPRASLSLNGSPNAPAITWLGFFGSTRMREMLHTSCKPTFVHVLPPSVVLRICFTRTDPHDVFIGRIDCHGADCGHRFLFEHGRPRRACVVRFPHAAARGTDVIQVRIAIGSGYGRNASAGDGGSDRTPLEIAVRRTNRRGENEGSEHYGVTSEADGVFKPALLSPALMELSDRTYAL